MYVPWVIVKYCYENGGGGGGVLITEKIDT